MAPKKTLNKVPHSKMVGPLHVGIIHFQVREGGRMACGGREGEREGGGRKRGREGRGKEEGNKGERGEKVAICSLKI